MSAAETWAPAPVSETLASLRAGHLAALRVRAQIREGGDGLKLVQQARDRLRDDETALGAFGRSLATPSSDDGRRVTAAVAACAERGAVFERLRSGTFAGFFSLTKGLVSWRWSTWIQAEAWLQRQGVLPPEIGP